MDQSDTEAASWYRQAANKGYALAQSNLGGMYEDGRGGEKSDTAAVSWHRNIAEQGHAGRQLRLGNMYLYGRGVDKSDVEAADCLRKAAEQGDPLGQSNLACIADIGVGLEQSNQEAFVFQWCRLTLQGGTVRHQTLLQARSWDRIEQREGSLIAPQVGRPGLCRRQPPSPSDGEREGSRTATDDCSRSTLVVFSSRRGRQ